MARLKPSRIVTIVDLSGTFVFAIEGAMVAMQNGLDLLGVMVLAFVTALGGGIIRDVLLGAVPPEALRAWSTQQLLSPAAPWPWSPPAWTAASPRPC